MEKIIGKFVGPNKIKVVEPTIRKTYLKNKVLKLTYENGTIEERPEEQVIAMVTDSSRDLSSLRELEVKPVVQKILVILLEAELKLIDMDYVFQTIVGSINHNIDQAEEILWKKDKYVKTLYDVNKILTKVQKDDIQSK